MLKNSVVKWLSRKTSKIDRKYYFLHLVFSRTYVANNVLKEMRDNLDAPPLTDLEQKAIKEYWKDCPVNKDWFWYYNRTQRNHEDFDVRYMPDDLFTTYVYDYYNKLREVRAIDDKNLYDLYFPDVKQPKTIVHIIEGQYLDNNYDQISLEDAIKRCVECGEIVCKPSVLTAGGKDIVFWGRGESESELKDLFLNMKNAVVQECIHQHSSLEALHANSVNTIRIMTWFRDGKVDILSTIIRMGANGSKVDNMAAGGFCCGVNEDGSLKQWGYKEAGEPSLKHPQGTVFGECRLVGVDKCKNVATRLAYRIARVARMVSWDFTVDSEGNPIFIEMNLNNGIINGHQLANGPIFGDETKRIVSEVMNKRKYRMLNFFLNEC